MRIFEEVKEYAIIEIRPRMEGRQMMMIIAPNGKALARAEEPKEDNVPEPEAEAEAEAEVEAEE
jgi:translation initiation factor IF-3